jgi:radical SAM superfamily enzyme YgiQ (UPF0313 family)
MRAPLRFQIICPAARQFRIERPDQVASVRTRIFRFSMLSALSVAAAAPPEIETEIVDENLRPIDFDGDADIIGVSFMTYNAPRAYEIARRFHHRGKTVFFGGYHASLMPEEAARHADAVCIGEAEANLPRMLEDYRHHRLQKFYRLPYPELRALRTSPTLFRSRDYMGASVVQATRGCCHRCEFCSVSAFSEHTFKKKPVPDVVAEIRAGGRKRVLFMDDSLAADPDYLKALLQALVPLRIRWYSQIAFNVTRDRELLDLMRRSGCRGVFIGFESLVQESLLETRKGFNRAAEYKAGIRELHRRGIGVMAAFVLGYDHDGPDVFARTLDFLEDTQADALQLAVLTPFPGTPLFERLERQGRIHDLNWEHYDLGHVTFRPSNMTAAALEDGHNQILRRFYSWPCILRRLGRQLRYLAPTELGLLALLNWGYRLKIRQDGYVARRPARPLVS